MCRNASKYFALGAIITGVLFFVFVVACILRWIWRWA